VPDGRAYHLRWFTPTVEVPLCGHATLASAAVIMERLEPDRREVTFHTASGPLSVKRSETGYIMNFPARLSERISRLPELGAALGTDPIEVHADEFNYLALLPSAQILRDLAPDFAAIAHLDCSGVIVTAAGDGACSKSQGPLSRGNVTYDIEQCGRSRNSGCGPRSGNWTA
jgi:predicted PhzF superfamily epimerase YddE/YHI9